MTAKQPAGRLSLPVICGLSVLLALAAGAMYLSAGPAIRPHDAHPTASVAKPHFVNASLSANTDASHQRVLNAYGRLPLAFDANQGQTDPQVKYVARGNGYSLFLTSNKAVLSMSSGASSPLRDAMIRRYMGFTRWHKVMQQRARHAKTQVAVLNMEMVGANPQPQIVGSEPSAGRDQLFDRQRSQKVAHQNSAIRPGGISKRLSRRGSGFPRRTAATRI